MTDVLLAIVSTLSAVTVSKMAGMILTVLGLAQEQIQNTALLNQLSDHLIEVAKTSGEHR